MDYNTLRHYSSVVDEIRQRFLVDWEKIDHFKISDKNLKKINNKQYWKESIMDYDN
jgi:hypothetical protein